MVTTTFEILFWVSVFGVLYPYIGYPLALRVARLAVGKRDDTPADAALPCVTVIVPVHNEAARIRRKVLNTAELRYPADRLQVLFVSDGSTDRTVDLISGMRRPGMEVIALPVRGGKAAALNAGVQRAKHDIVVFTDASIELEPDALIRIVRRFADPRVGCVSGEDRIAESGGEGWYGRYELLLRRLESDVHSIVGASGSFYAQRRHLCAPFTEGMAPDFLSVLRTVEQGFRAVSDASAVGSMTSVKDPRQEFERKVRTSIRGMTTLFGYAHLLDPRRYGAFALALLSHKVLRWTVPFFLVAALLSTLPLLHVPFYLVAFLTQVAFYAGAAVALAQWGSFHRSFVGKVALYFSSVNAAIFAAWCQYGMGVRQELWTPSRR